MPHNKLPIDLTAELSKSAKLSNVINGLPGSMRVLPVAAIFAGSAISVVTRSPNLIEKGILGTSETLLLPKPGAGAPVSNAATIDEKIKQQLMEGQRHQRDEPS
jgi:hypothetical protein